MYKVLNYAEAKAADLLRLSTQMSQLGIHALQTLRRSWLRSEACKRHGQECRLTDLERPACDFGPFLKSLYCTPAFKCKYREISIKSSG